MSMRTSGVLMHISSLPSNAGIGTLGKEAYDFVDFLKKSGQSFWQVLPLCPTSYGDSPYQSFSTFAGNPYFIDFDMLCEDNLLKVSDYNTINWGINSEKVDYDKISANRFNVLKIAFNNFVPNIEYDTFCNENECPFADITLRNERCNMCIKRHVGRLVISKTCATITVIIKAYRMPCNIFLGCIYETFQSVI